jgi:adenylate cyclase
VSLRQNSASRLPRPSESQSTLYAPSDSNRRSGDDGESARGVAHSSSSVSGELRKSKSSLNLFSKLRSRPSKAHLRHDSEDSEHPSLRPPVPPLPEQKISPFFNITLPGPPISVKKDKRAKTKKGSEEMTALCPPPQTNDFDCQWEKELKGPINVDDMNGIINLSVATAGSNGFASCSSPSSAFDSSQSYSDHSFHSPNFLLPSEFSDPFSSTPVQEKRKGIIPSHGDYRKVSPKTLSPPYGLNGVNPSSSTTLVSGPGGPTWVPPESWAVNDPYNPSGNPELSEAPDSGSDDNLHNIPASLVNGRRKTIGYDVPKSRKGKQPNAVEHRITFKVKQPPPDFSYRMKIYRQDNSYHVVAIKLQSTVSELNAKLARKLLSANDRVQHNLYLKERGQGTLFYLFLVSPSILTSFLQSECWVNMILLLLS